MIPSVFVSSTIADLHYLRDGIRDAIEDLAYRPVMSEYGEIGYINSSTAAESCYRSVRQCQIVILIVGRRYGSIDSDGFSVTHREYLAAKDSSLPTITFVEPEVLSFKEVFDSSPDAVLWDTFERMDKARSTFGLLDAIRKSDTYNAILPFASVSDAKRKLKLQIADFVGDRLSDITSPVNQQIRDILAEVRTLRNIAVHTSPSENENSRVKRFLAVTRYLLNERCKEYRELLVRLFSDIDIATETVESCITFECVAQKAHHTIEVVDSIKFSFSGPPGMEPSDQTSRMVCATSFGNRGGYEMYSDKRLRIAAETLELFQQLQKTIHTKASMT